MGEASNDQILAAVLDLKQDMGRVEARVENTELHVVAVSRKTDALREDLETAKAAAHNAPCKALVEHMDAYSAHGARAAAYVGGVVAALLASGLGVIELYKRLTGGR